MSQKPLKRSRTTHPPSLPTPSPLIWLKHAEHPAMPISATNLSFEGQPVIVVGQLIDVIKAKMPSQLGSVDSNRILLHRHDRQPLGMSEEITSIAGNTETTPHIISIYEPKAQYFSFSDVSLTPQYIQQVTGVTIPAETWGDVNVNPSAPMIYVLDESVSPSPEFLTFFMKGLGIWMLNSEMARRHIINMILWDIVSRDEFRHSFAIECEANLNVMNRELNKELGGSADYCIGRKTPFDHLQEINLVALEAKKEFPKQTWIQCFAEAACLYKQRVDHNKKIDDQGGDESRKKNPRVWGIYTNASTWQFLHIDNHGQLFITEDSFSLTLPEIGLDFHGQLNKIYRMVHYIIRNALISSPVPSAFTSLENLAA